MRYSNFGFSSFFSQITIVIFLACGLPKHTLAQYDMEIAEVAIRNNKFEPEEIKVSPGKKIKLIVTNYDNTIEEFESSSLRREKIIPPGKTVNIMLAPLSPGEYSFIGEFHPETAKGKLIVE
ncbi:MAG: cupredoxin domain-containing protein [Rickettsiaceae bacterium]|nr:cupredoxin domain-containing protein [Rickettsiaceae bacterium]